MFCAQCGAQIDDKAVVCPKCGVPVAGSKPATQVAAVGVPNHLVGAILTALFCCLIGGIIAIIYSTQANTKLAMGDVDGAKAAAKTAQTWIFINLGCGALVALFYLIMIIVDLVAE